MRARRENARKKGSKTKLTDDRREAGEALAVFPEPRYN
jgi:hypothetical protein